MIKPRGAASSVHTAWIACKSGQRRHNTTWSHLSEYLVPGVRDINVARTVHRHAVRVPKPRLAAGSVSTAMIARQSGDGTDRAGRCHFANRMIAFIRNEEIALAIHCH